MWFCARERQLNKNGKLKRYFLFNLIQCARCFSPAYSFEITSAPSNN